MLKKVSIFCYICFIPYRLDRRLSKDVKNLILKLFEPEEFNRPTFEQVLQHSWILKYKKEEKIQIKSE